MASCSRLCSLGRKLGTACGFLMQSPGFDSESAHEMRIIVIVSTSRNKAKCLEQIMHSTQVML